MSTTKPGRPPVTVLQVLAAPSGRTTYVSHMLGMGPAELTTLLFSWRIALLGRYDVLHVHWPEGLLRARRPDLPLRWVGFLLLLLRLRVRNIPLVRTEHNPDPHESGLWGERRLLALLDRRTDVFIRLNRATPPRPGKVSHLIPHGHYRHQFAALALPASTPGRLLLIGRLRPYKGISELLSAMRAWPRRDVSLRIVGSTRSQGLRRDVLAACAQDARVSATLEFVPDAALVAEVGRAELVVLPYREMHNSGILLVALSLDRPVLAPRTPSNEAIADEVGQGWLRLYDGELDACVLDQALEHVRGPGRAERPDLSDRDWDRVGRRHYAAYLDGLTLTRLRASRRTAPLALPAGAEGGRP